MRIFGTVLLTGLAGSFAASGYKDKPQLEKPPIVKEISNVKTKEVMDAERKIVQEEEYQLINKLHNVVLDVALILPGVQLEIDDLKERKKIADMYDKFDTVHTNFIDKTIGSKDEFFKQPNEKQLEAFRQCVSAADKAAIVILPHVKDVSLDNLGKKIERNYRKLKESRKEQVDEKKLKEFIENSLTPIEFFKEDLKSLPKKSKSFIKAVESFNKDAKAAGQLMYESKWGLSPDFLKSLKSIK